jgi:hypothetical protein
MPSSFRCSLCGTNYPHKMDFRICLTCGAGCWADYQTAPDMDDADAQQLLNEREFERYYEAREKRQVAEQAAAIANLPETPER